MEVIPELPRPVYTAVGGGGRRKASLWAGQGTRVPGVFGTDVTDVIFQIIFINSKSCVGAVSTFDPLRQCVRVGDLRGSVAG